jgi:hypothetical protein
MVGQYRVSAVVVAPGRASNLIPGVVRVRINSRMKIQIETESKPTHSIAKHWSCLGSYHE